MSNLKSTVSIGLELFIYIVQQIPLCEVKERFARNPLKGDKHITKCRWSHLWGFTDIQKILFVKNHNMHYIWEDKNFQHYIFFPCTIIRMVRTNKIAYPEIEPQQKWVHLQLKTHELENMWLFDAPELSHFCIYEGSESTCMHHSCRRKTNSRATEKIWLWDFTKTKIDTGRLVSRNQAEHSVRLQRPSTGGLCTVLIRATVGILPQWHHGQDPTGSSSKDRWGRFSGNSSFCKNQDTLHYVNLQRCRERTNNNKTYQNHTPPQQRPPKNDQMKKLC